MTGTVSPQELAAAASERVRQGGSAFDFVRSRMDGFAAPPAMSIVPALSEIGLKTSVEYGRDAARAFELLLWLEPPLAARYVKAGEFFCLWKLDKPVILRFRHVLSVFNRAAFEVAEWLPARDLSRLPQDALWLPSKPPSPPPGATT